ncbi:hypothetical protein LMG7974_01740 [Campylobacter majalis]|uniref:Type I restriction modification DNA specificity domain-containing protein n=1 Tax=Campylobacter majalis TaxID=2790656 RepID=A0ABM8Q9W8_9BACT|nr:hypothetical protein LMG7974_01740 [Campylobacter majalis]
MEFRKLGEIGETFAGLRGKNKEHFKDGNAKYVTYMNIFFNNPATNLQISDLVQVKTNENQNFIKKGDFLVAGSSENLEDSGMISVVCEKPLENIYLNSFCFGFRFYDEFVNLFEPNFLKHYFRSNFFRNQIRKCSFGVTRFNLNKNKFLNLKIPIPPIKVQNEIVRILDSFAKLEAELEARRRQYRFYRDKLLNFDTHTVKWVSLGEICEIVRGGNFQKKDFLSNGFPCIHYGQIYTKYGIFANETISFVSDEVAKKSKKAQTNDIIMAITSENVEDVCKSVAWLGKDEIAVSGHTAIIKHNQNAKFLTYYFHSKIFQNQKRKLAHGIKVIEVTPKDLLNLKIPLPSLKNKSR